jgi:DNA polymerase III alpha subunit
LHCHSHYSFLRGVASPEEIIAAAVEQKMPAVALTDTNGLYAAVSFYQAAKKAGIQPIIGVVLDVEWRRGVGSSVISSAARPLRLCFLLATRHSSLDCVPRDGHGRLQQSLPTRDAASSRHNTIVTRHEFT